MHQFAGWILQLVRFCTLKSLITLLQRSKLFGLNAKWCFLFFSSTANKTSSVLSLCATVCRASLWLISAPTGSAVKHIQRPSESLRLKEHFRCIFSTVYFLSIIKEAITVHLKITLTSSLTDRRDDFSDFSWTLTEKTAEAQIVHVSLWHLTFIPHLHY